MGTRATRTLGGLTVTVWLAAAMLSEETSAGYTPSLVERIACSDAAVELTLIFDRPIPTGWKLTGPTNRRFPPALAVRARNRAKLEVVAGDVDLKKIRWNEYPLELSDGAWWQAHAKRRVRALAFLRRSNDGWFRPVLPSPSGFPADVWRADYDAEVQRTRDQWKTVERLDGSKCAVKGE